MEISNVDVKTYKIPLPEPVEAYAAGVMKAFDLVICKITNNDGIQGVGYITVHENQGLAISQIIKNSFKPLLLKQDPRLIELLWKNMWKATHYAGRGAPVSFAIAAVDVALWDLKGKCLKEPLWRLLGGHDKKVTAYAGNIDLNFSKEKLLDGATKSLDKGFKAIKMRLGRESLSEDIERLDAMRNHLPDNIMLMADANEAWRIDQVVATEAESVGNSDIFSIFSTAGSDGIWTQADAIMPSIPFVSNFFHNSAGAFGSCAATSRLLGISSARKS